MPEKTKIATFDEVAAIPCPPATKTFRPISHGDLVRTLRYACKRVGIGIKGEEYTLARDGRRIFGTFDLAPFVRGNGRSFTLGFRQGVDKSMSIGICAGLTVTVCSNMMFDGEFLEFRKHTSGLDDSELNRIAFEAVSSAMGKMISLKKWHDRLKTVKVNKYKFKCLTYDAMTQGVFAPANLSRFLLEYGNEREEQHHQNIKTVPHDIDTLYTWHGGVTRLLRGKSMFQVAESNRILQGICDNYTVHFDDD